MAGTSPAMTERARFGHNENCCTHNITLDPRGIQNTNYPALDSIPRRGIVVVRKSKREIVEMITVWAAIESMAARLAAARVTPGDIAELHTYVDAFRDHRAVTMTRDNRAQRSVADHIAIIDALAAGDSDLAERLTREHTMGLAAHVEKYGDFLDAGAAASAIPANRLRRHS